VSDRYTIIGYRVRVVYFGLVLSWVALIITAAITAAHTGFDGQIKLGPALGAGVALLILTVVPWRRALRRAVGDFLVLLWCLGVIGAVIYGTGGLETGASVVVVFLATVVFAALVASRSVGFVGVAAIAAYVALLLTNETVDAAEAAVQIAIFVMAVALIFIGGLAVWAQIDLASQWLRSYSRREAHLAEREQELQRLYDVSRTIGVGTNLAEVLPELVGRVVSALEAKIGVVLLYRPDLEALEVMSPIWVAGQTLRAEGYLLRLDEDGIAQRVFTSGEPLVYTDMSEAHEAGDSFLIELGTHQVVAVPLRIEAHRIGVLLVVEKQNGEFVQKDVALLESLAGPSALVLNQLTRYEEARETSQKMTELAQLKTDFVSVVSHELRTPLTSMIGSLKTLQRPELAPPDPNARELVNTASRQANRLRSLIEDLLMVSRLDNQALPIRPESLAVADFLDEIVRHVPGAEEVTSIHVAPTVDLVEADPDHLHRVVSNLLDNALKYAPDSPIELSATRNGGEVWLSVADHGMGIPYELHEHIFDSFTQVAPHHTRGAGGTGLGLSIVRGLSEAMGGRVWFQPTPGGGATFTVALPQHAATRQARAV
jgi:K+-sensing histidine kinase KdpD